MNNKTKIIAFYLPQFHPTLHNNEWWGEGFTEWTNVAKARKLFPGHYQPKIPADLGFYDLRLPVIREKQVDLAKEAGISGFCYYHYWFGNGRQELELPFNEVVASGKPDFPFCLCWANETWSKKFWNKDGTVSKMKSKILIDQQYPGEEDVIAHFMSLLPAFKDHRYMKIDGRLIFMIYRPLAYEKLTEFIHIWNKLASENGLEGFYFIGYTTDIENEYEMIKGKGADAVCSCRMLRHKRWSLLWVIRKIVRTLSHMPERYEYRKVYPTLIGKEEVEKDDVFPTMMPNWDHTPRSGYKCYLYTHSTPELFEEHVRDVLCKISRKPASSQICFLKSWNEWGEGNYMEPDLKYGKGYIRAMRNAIEECY